MPPPSHQASKVGGEVLTWKEVTDAAYTGTITGADFDRNCDKNTQLAPGKTELIEL
jgi:hypothetical protein